jgi:hypothetical protein
MNLINLGPIKKWSDGPLVAPRPGPGHPPSVSTNASVPLASLISVFVDKQFEQGEGEGEGGYRSPAAKVSKREMNGGKYGQGIEYVLCLLFIVREASTSSRF